MSKGPSLFKRLLLGFLCVMLPVWLALLGIFLVEQSHSSNDMETRWMRLDADKVLASVRSMADRPDAIRDAAENIERLQNAYYLNTSMEHRYRVQVWRGGTPIYTSHDLSLTAPAVATDGTVSMPGVAAWNYWVARDPATGLIVRIAQRNGPKVLSSSILSFYFLPLIVCFPFLMIPAWFVTRHGLRPLAVIVQQIEARSGSELSALVASPYVELAPLVESVNMLLHRLSQRLLREKEFLADAAHELKTPLAIVQLNSDALLAANDAARRQAAHTGLAEGLARATHTVHQLIALARSEADASTDAAHPLDLAELLRDRMVQVVQLALRHGIEIELQAPESCMLNLHRESMASLIDNLLDNAIKYSPQNSRVSVSLKSGADGNGVQLCVSDAGPGIPIALRRKVFERFSRVPGQDQSGSGLGLAIAELAAQRNGATIVLETGTDGVGLLARVEFDVQA
jgi:signal transduction histidine kinase